MTLRPRRAAIREGGVVTHAALRRIRAFITKNREKPVAWRGGGIVARDLDNADAELLIDELEELVEVFELHTRERGRP